MARCSTRRTASGSSTPSRSGWPAATSRERLPGLADAPVVETRVCQYETTPDTHFIIDRHPDYDNVWIAGGGSGHAFKHGPVIGRYVIERIGGAPAGPEGDRFGLDHVREPKPNMRTGADGMVEGWSGW